MEAGAADWVVGREKREHASHLIHAALHVLEQDCPLASELHLACTPEFDS
jgi:hypothetical protein